MVQVLARRVIPEKTAYKDISYKQAFMLSTAYQGGVVAWVAFWAFYGQGFGAQNIANVFSFGAAYALVILVEPLLDMAILGAAKSLHQLSQSKALNPRLFRAAA
jgi:hypothetical protein